MKVYDSFIEICLQPVFMNVSRRDDKAQRKLDSVYDRYFTPTKAAPVGTTTQERALIRLFWERASNEYKVARENGYVGSYHNCVLKLLHGVFGLDIIAYLFNQAWVPETAIEPFHPELFLERLSVLERAAMKLADGAKTPVKLSETAAYFRPDMGPELNAFSEEKHRLLLDYSLRELRDFGELGLSLQAEGEKLTVSIRIYTPRKFHDPEIMAFAAGPKDAPVE
jgi:hypothetical protein